MKDRTIHVDRHAAGRTVAALLRDVLKEISWNDVKHLIAQRHVQIDGNLCLDDARRLRGDEVIKVYSSPRAPIPTASDVKIIHRDEHLVVVEKPAGMTTLRHEQERHWSARRKQIQPTLEEVLETILSKPTPAKRQHKRIHHRSASPRVRPVHRLDRDTSGLMVFALSPDAERSLIELFKAHHIEREYRAVVRGHPKAATIESFLVRDRGDGLRGSVADSSRGGAQRAVTHLRPIESIGDYSIIACRLETGRTHQIRIHLSELGHPLCGEKTYTHAVGERPRPDKSGAPRQALHAAVLGFVHPITGRKLRFESPWPRELADWLAGLVKSK